MKIRPAHIKMKAVQQIDNNKKKTYRIYKDETKNKCLASLIIIINNNVIVLLYTTSDYI